MKAAQYFGQRDIRVVDVPEPVPEPNEVLLSIEWGGICGSDLHEYVMGPMAIPPKERPHKLTGETLPVTMGHEFCGRIKQAPEGSALKVGQAVMVDPRGYCRSCHRCQINATHACQKLAFKGLSGKGGGFSQTVAIEERLCYPLPEDLLSYAALIEPLAVAWHAVKMPGLESYKGKTVLIVGGGPIGIALIFALRHWGANCIFVSEPTSARRKQNAELANEVFNPLEQKVGDLCRQQTNGEGVDVVFDAAGTPPGLVDGMDALKYRGVYINVAAWEKPFVVPFFHFMLKEITMVSSLVYNDDDFGETVEQFVNGAFKGVEKMVTDRIYLDDVVEKGFEALVKSKDDHIKILVTPRRELI